MMLLVLKNFWGTNITFLRKGKESIKSSRKIKRVKVAGLMIQVMLKVLRRKLLGFSVGF